MDATPAQFGLFPELTPEPVSARAETRRYVPKTYTQEDVEIARRVIVRWNEAFNGCAGGKRANAGDSCNVKAVVRMLKHMRKSNGQFAFTEDEIARAIVAYRNDPHNVKNHRWTYFSEWISCESIDAQLSRVGLGRHMRSAAGPKTEDERRQAQAKAAAEHVVEGSSFWRTTMHAMKQRISLREYIAKQTAQLTAGDGGFRSMPPEWIDGAIRDNAAMIRTLDAFEQLLKEDSDKLLARAHNVHRAYSGNVPAAPPVLVALACSLMWIDSRKVKPTEQGGSP